MKNKHLHLVYWLFFSLLMILAAFLNLQGMEGYVGAENPLSAWDELFSVKEVYTILTPDSFKSFALSIIAGKGYLYGRLIYMCDAIIAFLPYKVFGLKGLIFSIRMAHTFYMLFGFYLISKFVSQSIKNQLFSLVIFSIFPVVIYFSVMPKPEPMQLLLIGLFFNFYKKYPSAWIFIGMALGSKISIAFSCMAIFVWLLNEIRIKNIGINEGLKKMSYGLIGLVVALPGLPFAIFNKNFRFGIIQIFSNTRKPYDDPNINFMDWVQKLLNYYELPIFLSYVLVLVIFTAAIFAFFKHPQQRLYICFAILAILPIMIFTKRLWGHYLFFGMAMLLPFIFTFADEIVNNQKTKLYLNLALTLLFSASLMVTIPNYKYVLDRNKGQTFLTCKQKTLTAIKYCKSINPQAKIGVDLSLYYQYNWYLATSIQPITIDRESYKALNLDYVLIHSAEVYVELPIQFRPIKNIDGLEIYTKNN